MTGDGLTVNVSGDDPVLVTVQGEIDLLTAADLARPLRELIMQGPGTIDVDLSEVPFMDSTGIQVLTATHADAQAAGIALRVIAVSAPVLRVLGLTGLLDTLGLTPPARTDEHST
jgi:anti-anti-sigma factor